MVESTVFSKLFNSCVHFCTLVEKCPLWLHWSSSKPNALTSFLSEFKGTHFMILQVGLSQKGQWEGKGDKKKINDRFSGFFFSLESRVHKNKSMQRLISSLSGHWHGEISSNVTFAYCTKGCIDVAVLRGRPLTHVRSLSLSHDFLQRTLIVITMIYKRRYGWHKDVFILFKRSDDQRLRQWK